MDTLQELRSRRAFIDRANSKVDRFKRSAYFAEIRAILSQLDRQIAALLEKRFVLELTPHQIEQVSSYLPSYLGSLKLSSGDSSLAEPQAIAIAADLAGLSTLAARCRKMMAANKDNK